MIQFRAARTTDLAAVLELLAEDWQGETPDMDLGKAERDFAEMMALGGTSLFVGFDGDEIVATYQFTLVLGVSFSTSRRVQIEAVRVRSTHRGQGIGACLMQDAEARARAAGADLMQLTSNAVRRDAHRFYERLGFEPSHVGFKKRLSADHP